VFAEYAGKTAVGRIGRAEDVADAIAFLVSNGFMTGQVLTCDGGLRFAA
ncbi:SDR family oxidoreductase, partial [Mesorhizobium sp.]